MVSLHSLSFRYAVFVVLTFGFFGAAKAETSDVETTWRLLDYIAVDYAGAVTHGAVTSPSEYTEQNEFAATVAEKLAALPPKPERHARQGASRSVAALHPREGVEGTVRRVGLVPVSSRLHCRLSRGVRDHPLLCGALEPGKRRGDSRWRSECLRRARGHRVGDAALQPPATDRQVLHLQ